LKLGAGHVTIVDAREKPNLSRCTVLVERCAAIFGKDRISTSTDIVGSIAAADGVIHTTATGMLGHPGIALPATLLRSDLWVAEIVYFPLETELLRAARAAGCPTLDGSWMAVYQAVEALHLYSGLEPDPERMHNQVITTMPAQ